jgi:hypothetical protein
MNDSLLDQSESSPDKGEDQNRRQFLQSTGKWSSAAIMAAVAGGWLGTAKDAHARGAWVNRRGGGGGGWVNRGGGGWVNRRVGGGGWINRW